MTKPVSNKTPNLFFGTRETKMIEEMNQKTIKNIKQGSHLKGINPSSYTASTTSHIPLK